jgi:SAM-dependent methyltransferase
LHNATFYPEVPAPVSEQPNWMSAGVDTTMASSARIDNFLLGGGHNFEVDRQIARRCTMALPGAAKIARLNREFLCRAVLFMVEQGIRQFLDIGSGIATVGNVHQIAQRAAHGARVLYVDREPIAVNHSQLMLGANPTATALQHDLRDPDGIMDHTEVRRLLDLDQPLGLVLVGVLHFIAPADHPQALLARYRQRLAPGSFLPLSHVTADSRRTEMAAMLEVMNNSADPLHPRSRDEVVSFFDGFDLVDPGVVPTTDWRPTGPYDIDGPERKQIYAGVGRTALC